MSEQEPRQGVFGTIKHTHKQMTDRLNDSWFGRSVAWAGRNFGAFYRQGAKEVAQILPAFPESVKPVEELGTMGNPTQLEINRELGNVESGTVHGKPVRDDSFDAMMAEQARKGAGREPEVGLSR